jgi:hypothetical protein
MSCEQCQIAQETNKSAFYRWKNANIELRGCDEHLKEIFEVLSEAQVPTIARRLEALATKAARTGDKTDLQEYLKLRRQTL